MTAISTPRTKDPTFLESPVQATGKNKEILEGRRVAYGSFLRWLETYRDWDKLPQGQKEHLVFMLTNHETIFNNVDHKKIKELSEENFPQFLLSVYKKIRAENLAGEKSLNEVKIREIVNECIDDIRGTETVDSLKKLVGKPFGIKIDTKNFWQSIKDGLLEKIPILGKVFGKGKKEEDDDKPALTNEGMTKRFLRKSFLPILFFALALLLSGPIGVFGLFTIPHIVVISIAVIAFVSAEYKEAKNLVSNDKKGTVYNPGSEEDQCFSCHEQDIVGKSAELAAKREEEEAKKKEEELGEKISNGISEIVHSPLTKGAEKSGKSSASLEEVLIERPGQAQSTQWQQMVEDKKAARDGNDGPRIIQ
ncbi:hypothetical protein [Wolbachia endosymbiont of Folsomia candida]|uniref:hypothetical protein n=1 Tax=Wolbachia endosymbiont of Folsomia candida TaxID=169402 RepID=UPI000B1345D2|nr:hypothetical protein [Wolbachia endosymbiont of Folsomia candida]APR98295.1 hypothetical protein ASM33_03255 [Wolbachia endosymbiont of Folsomia candida]